MHRVNHGREPRDLKRIRTTYTPRWVQYYSMGVGKKPTDSYWRSFHNPLKGVFQGICGYCEERRKGEIDHFRPKKRFPHLVYSWSNWIFACHECNNAKLDKWPDTGYVDPCARFETGYPDRYFVFDTQTGQILPNPSRNSHTRHKAQETINALHLNDAYHLTNRLEWLVLFSASISNSPNNLTVETKQNIKRFTSRQVQYSSIVRVWLSERGFTY